MRSRSHRLFVILFHLIVFHIPKNNYISPGQYAGMIIGVHPSPISLERIKLDEYSNGLVGFMNTMIMMSSSSSDANVNDILKEPFWIQDNVDGKCLGPSGSFSDCGDTTLWFIRAKKDLSMDGVSNILTKGIQRIIRLMSGGVSTNIKGDEVEDVNWKFALQSSNHDMSSSSSSSNKHEEFDSKGERDRDGECLVLLRNRKHNTKYSFRLRSCKKESAWNWNVNSAGYLMSLMNKKKQQQEPHLAPNVCVWRDWNSTNTSTKSSSTLAAPCLHDDDTRNSNSNNQYRQVSFSLVRLQQAGTVSSLIPQPTAINSSPNLLHNNNIKSNSVITTSTSVFPANQQKEHPLKKSSNDNTKGNNVQTPKTVTTETTKGHVPHSMTASESHAHASLHHLELLPMNSLRIPPDTATNLLKGGNPLLFHSQDAAVTSGKSSATFNNLNNRNSHSSLGSTSSLKPKVTITPTSSRPDPTNKLSHANKIKSVGGIESHHFIKMPSHPYITESKGTGIWTDESTGLQYPTDLVSFLGNDRKTHGRHTLMGVGLYTRTVLKVKIYGIALYVSKRDVLADSQFSKYAMSTKEELQTNDEFYKYLYSNPNTSDGTASFDRTLMIKLNMQLGVETIRTCLQSEWKYLTDEHKDMLIGSSLKKRDADEEMLGIIKDEENTSNCSCSQTAPEEYGADTTCCARGTEMVFTWRKDGTLELRMNRRYIDSFPSEVAQGIFYEYLRVDDPMSVDARLNFATGFPFLLAPLAQVKGVVVGGKSIAMGTSGPGSNLWHNNEDHTDDDRDAKIKSKKSNPFLIDIGHTIIKQSKNVLFGSVSNVCHVAQTGLGSLQEAGTEFHLQVTKLIGKHHQHNKQQLTIHVPTNSKDKIIDTESPHQHHTTTSFPSPLAFDNNAPYIDEIAVNMPPTNDSFTHKLFSFTVHLYLLLLLVISIPESYNIKTIRMVANRSKEAKLSSPRSKNDKHISSNISSITNKNNNDTISGTYTVSGANSPSIPLKVRTSFSRNTSFRDSFSIMPIIQEVEQEEEEKAADVADGIFYDDDPITTDSNNEKSNIKKSLSYFL